MGVVDFLFAPRKDHRGWSTPSEAARLLLPLTLIAVGFWAWPKTDGNFVMWFSLVFFVSTPLLTVGWWLISLVSARTETKVLFESVNHIDRSKRVSIHSFRKP